VSNTCVCCLFTIFGLEKFPFASVPSLQSFQFICVARFPNRTFLLVRQALVLYVGRGCDQFFRCCSCMLVR
jgi:hypothetical protein